MHVVVVGCGYVGLVSGACLAELGHKVICVDANPARIATLNSGNCPIFEPGLDTLLARNGDYGRLTFSSEIPPLGRDIDAVIIAVGTPPLFNGGGADLTSVFAVANDVAAKAHDGVVVAIKSTVPPGTGDMLERQIRAARPDLALSVASNPEFLREGSAISDFLRPDRIVIGTEDPRARHTLRQLYEPLIRQGRPLIMTTRMAAEITKYAANAFLALKITYINEIADLCEAAATDVRDVAKGIGLDHRIGAQFLRAGPGYGGSCFPKDTSAMAATAREFGMSLRLVEEAILINDERKLAMGRRVIAAMGGDVRGMIVGILGLTFKPNTDDMRDSPALAVISVLQQAGATVRVYDPQGMRNAPAYLADVIYARDSYDCVAGSNCAVLMTEWAEFTQLDLQRVAAVMADPLLVDLRNALDPVRLTEAGILYAGIGHCPSGTAAGLESSGKHLARSPCTPETKPAPLQYPDHATIQ